MSVMNKPDYKIFAQDAKSGEYVAFPDILRGWGITLEQYNGFPPMELFNSAAKRIDEWLMYLTQRGLPEWDAVVDYPKDAMIQHAGVYYVSLKATKGEQPNNSQASWKKLTEFLGVDGKLAKDKNGADIQDKEKFIENLGLPEKFSPLSVFFPLDGKAVIKTGEVYDYFVVSGGAFGSYNPQIDQWNFHMPVTGPEQTTGQQKNRVMSQKAVSDMGSDIYSKMFGVGMTFRDVTAERTVGTNYVNSSLKPRVVYFVGMPAQATTNSLTTTGKINDKTVVQFVDASATAGDIRSFILVVPPGASYSCHSASHTVSGFNYWFEWE